MRRRLEETATENNLKRGPGGHVDIDFLIQMLRLREPTRLEGVSSNTWAALDELSTLGSMASGLAEELSRAYTLLRTVESGLQLMNAVPRHDVPSTPTTKAGLAYLLEHPDVENECDRVRAAIRETWHLAVE